MHIALGKHGFTRLPPGCILLKKRREIVAQFRHKLTHSLYRVKDQGGVVHHGREFFLKCTLMLLNTGAQNQSSC